MQNGIAFDQRNWNSGSIEFNVTLGCMDPFACNYNKDANVDYECGYQMNCNGVCSNNVISCCNDESLEVKDRCGICRDPACAKCDDIDPRDGFCDSSDANSNVCSTIYDASYSFAENNNAWHHSIMTEKLYNEAIKEIE